MGKYITLIISIFFLLLAVALGSLFFNSAQNNQLFPEAAPTPTPILSVPIDATNINYAHVFPNENTAKQITSTLQGPTDFKKQGDLTAITFPTGVKDRNNVVYEKNGIAQYVVQEITTDNTDLTDFKNLFPDSESFHMYDVNTAGVGFSWFIFPTEGVAFLANENYGGYVIRTIYFAKTTKDNFMQNAAKIFNMLSSDPYANQQETFGEQPTP